MLLWMIARGVCAGRVGVGVGACWLQQGQRAAAAAAVDVGPRAPAPAATPREPTVHTVPSVPTCTRQIF